jgi:uncharacterized membrane protein AbrB (regulator of aidB expression)
MGDVWDQDIRVLKEVVQCRDRKRDARDVTADHLVENHLDGLGRDDVRLSLSGVITQRPPAEIIWAAQFFIAIAVGVNYVGITARELRIDVGAGIVYSAILACISLAFFEIVSLTGIAAPLNAFLAFLPGGQAEMVVIAIIAGSDLAYVVSHHLLRIVLVIMLAPAAARLFR